MQIQFGAATYKVDRDVWTVRKGEISKFEKAMKRELPLLDTDAFDVDLTATALPPHGADANDDVVISAKSVKDGKPGYHRVRRQTASRYTINPINASLLLLVAPVSKAARELLGAFLKSWRGDESVDKFVARAFKQIHQEIEEGKSSY